MKRIMAHLFKQMYECEIDFDALTVEKLIDFVFTEIVYRKIQQLEEEAAQAKQDEDYGRPWHGFESALRPSMMKNAGYTMLSELLIC